MSRTLVLALILLLSGPISALSLKGHDKLAPIVRTEMYPQVSIEDSGVCGSDGVNKRLINESVTAATVVVCLETHQPSRQVREFSTIDIGAKSTAELGCTAGESETTKHYSIHWAGFSDATPPEDVTQARQNIFVFTSAPSEEHVIQNRHSFKKALVDYEYKGIRYAKWIEPRFFVSPGRADKTPPRIIGARFDKPYMGTHCVTSVDPARSGGISGNNCKYEGKEYSAGAVMCQSKKQHRCTDGAWVSLESGC
jgi:hypothetical protein